MRPGAEVVRAEVDERADRPLLADRPRRSIGSLTPFWSETTKPSGARRGAIAIERRGGVLALDGQQDGAEPVRQLVRQDGRQPGR